jgi:phosphopantothenoylcysteine decarboxylase/phosphopantothenate--cysteine ligase
MKTVVIGVTGGIAAYKSCTLVSTLRKFGYAVKVIMTDAAKEFVTPLTFETLSNNRVITDMFDEKRDFSVEHISLAKEAACFVIAPATANIIAKLANGIADDMLSSTVLATRAQVIVCPAMNTGMYENPATLKNIDILKQKGMLFVEPEVGFLACGDEGKGRMAEPETIAKFVDSFLTPNADLRGKTFLISAGATREPLDAVRFISNHSSGKMGMALAYAVAQRGGKVILVKAFTTVDAPKDAEVIEVETTGDMHVAVLDNLNRADVIIKAAAPCDYKVENYSENKIKVENLKLEFSKNADIAADVGEKIKGTNKKLVVFAAETEELLKNAQAKLKAKNAHIVVANDVTKEGAGFNVDTNIATILTNKGAVYSTEKITKDELAHKILDTIFDYGL